MDDDVILCRWCKQTFTPKYFERHSIKCKRRIDTNERHDRLNVLSDESDVEMDYEQLAESVNNDVEINSNQNENEEMNEADAEEELIHDHETFLEMVRDFESEMACVEMEPKIDEQTLFTKYACRFLAIWQYTFGITDYALKYLITFLFVLIATLVSCVPGLGNVVGNFPSSLYKFQKIVNEKPQQNGYTKYVVCTKCYKLYSFKDCITTIQGEKVSKKCDNVAFRNHRQKQHRKPCGQLLLSKVSSPSGEVSFVPFKTYCYKSIKESLKNLLERKGFEEDCEKWRERKTKENVMADVYDGEMWKKFSDPEEYDFFTKKRNYGVMLNVDWFNPYKHVKYSIGAIYLVLMNLPRSERFKPKNILLVGLIPSMAKEPANINSFLEPLVCELRQAWIDGFRIKLGRVIKTFGLALLCIGCDIPACRKLCGFLGMRFKAGFHFRAKCAKDFFLTVFA